MREPDEEKSSTEREILPPFALVAASATLHGMVSHAPASE